MALESNSSEELVLSIIGCLIEHEFTKAKNLVDEEKQVNDLVVGSWDLVPKVCELINEDYTCVEGFVETCEYIFVRLCDIGNVKELLLIFLEQADQFTDHDLYITLLAPLQKCLLKLTTRRGHSMTLVLETMYAHMSILPKPDAQQLEGEQRKLLDSDNAASTIEKVLVPFLTFVEPFINDCGWETDNDSKTKERDALLKCLLMILDHPLAFFDLTSDKDSDQGQSRSRPLAETVIHNLSKLQSNFAKYLLAAREKIEIQNEEKEQNEAKKAQGEKSGENDDDGEEKEIIPELGVSVLAYLIFSEHLQIDNLPQVMTYQYWLELNLPFISCMLKKPEWLVQEKGVLLLESILNCIPIGSLPADFFGTYRIKLLLQSLLQLLCRGQNKEVCQNALKRFTSLLWCFTPEGRYKFILFILKKSKHSGMLGYCITQLKELIDKNLVAEKQNEHFMGVQLTNLLKVVFTLPDGETTSLMDHSAGIMSALNLLRYLVVRDKPSENITGIWSFLPQLEKTYCEQLRMGINMSRAHFQMDLENTKKGKTAKTSMDIDFSMGSDSVPGLSKEQKIQTLSVALHTFDMMESVLGRVNELVAQAQRADSS